MAKCNKCEWRGKNEELGSKQVIYCFVDPETGQGDGNMELEPCCPKCGSTNVDFYTEEDNVDNGQDEGHNQEAGDSQIP